MLLRVDSEARQASAVAQRVQQLISEGAAPPDIAVLSRTRQHLLPVERGLWALDLPAARQGSAPHLKHVQAVLQLVLAIRRPFDAQDIANALPMEVGKTTLSRVLTACKIAAKSSSLEGQFIGCGKAYLKALGGMRNNKEANHAINAWAPMCRKYWSARSMLKALRPMSGAQGVTTSTIHQAKGKEWKHVIIVGCAEGVLPDYRATSEAKRLEELNTMYVAATRASETLTLVYAPHTIVRRHKRAIKAHELSSLLDHRTVLRSVDEEGV